MKTFISVFLILVSLSFLRSQSELELTNEGIILPNLSTDIHTIPPRKGQLIFDTIQNKIAYFNGSDYIFLDDAAQGFWQASAHGITFNNMDNVGVGANANSGTKLFVQGDYDEDPFRVQVGVEGDPNIGSTKMRILAKYNSVVFGSSWNSIDSSHLDALWSNYKKNYFRDSLQLRNPAEDPAILMTKGSGITIFDNAGNNIIDLDRNGLATVDDLSVNEEASFGKGLLSSDPVKLRESGNGPAGPEIQFMNDNSTSDVAAAIKVTNSTGGGNNHDLRIENRSIVGDISFSLDGTTHMRMNNGNNFSYVHLAPWIDNTTDLGLTSKRWRDIFTFDLDVEGIANLEDLIVSDEASLGGLISSDPIKIRELGNGPAGPEIQFMDDNSTTNVAASIKVSNSTGGGNNHTMTFNNTSPAGSMIFNADNSSTNFRMRGNINESFVTLAPVTTGNIDLGSTSLRWRTIYSQNNLNTSDIRLKRDIQELTTSVLPDLLQLRATTYHYLSDAKEDKKSVGFLAQEVENINPEWVVPPANEEDHYLINYNDFTVLAIKAIQEQQVLIDELSKEVDSLKEKLNK